MAENDNINPVEAHEEALRSEFAEASQGTISEDGVLDELKRRFDEANEKEKRATELATSNYEMDAAKVETDRRNNLGATIFTFERASELIPDDPQTKGGGKGATSAATATPSVVARSSNAPAAPIKDTNPVKTEPDPAPTPDSE